jgi:hypothetical protein
MLNETKRLGALDEFMLVFLMFLRFAFLYLRGIYVFLGEVCIYVFTLTVLAYTHVNI